MDHPFSFRISRLRMLNRWIVVTYFSLLHPILLFRRFHNGGMTNSTYFWIGMAVLVLALYLPQVLRDTRQATKIEFDGLVITFIYLFKRNMILPIQDIISIEESSKQTIIQTSDNTIRVSRDIPKQAITLLRQLHNRYSES